MAKKNVSIEIAVHIDPRERQRLQVFLAKNSPWHQKHLERETGRNDQTLDEIFEHFAGEEHHQGRSYASVFAEVYKRCVSAERAEKNTWYAGKELGREPTPLEAIIYLFCYHRIFGFHLKMLPRLIEDFKHFTIPKK